MGIFIGWIVFSILVGMLGSDRKIGFAAAFVLSLILSPLIGLFIALYSDPEQPKVITVHKPVQKQSSTDELIKLKSLVDSGALTQEEFELQKAKILSS